MSEPKIKRPSLWPAMLAGALAMLMPAAVTAMLLPAGLPWYRTLTQPPVDLPVLLPLYLLGAACVFFGVCMLLCVRIYRIERSIERRSALWLGLLAVLLTVLPALLLGLHAPLYAFLAALAAVIAAFRLVPLSRDLCRYTPWALISCAICLCLLLAHLYALALLNV